MPKIFQSIKQVSLYLERYSAKQSLQCLNIGSGYLFIQKSLEKQSQALKTMSLDLLYPVFLILSSLFIYQNTIV